MVATDFLKKWNLPFINLQHENSRAQWLHWKILQFNEKHNINIAQTLTKKKEKRKK